MGATETIPTGDARRMAFLPRSGVLENFLHFPVAPIDFISSAIPD
jgi:hypothetical protein